MNALVSSLVFLVKTIFPTAVSKILINGSSALHTLSNRDKDGAEDCCSMMLNGTGSFCSVLAAFLNAATEGGDCAADATGAPAPMKVPATATANNHR
jgi:hypothetical protein